MSDWYGTTPVAFLIFNRPETTARVFEAIRRVRPPKLLVVADGPRSDREGENEKCRAARSVIERVDWPCEVITNYADTNLGCRTRISSGLDWVFANVDEAIILEDDCLPDPSFFPFCEELLARYRDDDRIMMISGDNFQFGRRRGPQSYYFSQYTHIWGWATWKRAWRRYDVGMKLWPTVREGEWLFDILGDRRSVTYWTNIFDRVHQEKINTWDCQWMFSCWLESGLSIMPCTNLVSNIGFASDATHTSRRSPFSNMAVVPTRFPLQHPSFVIRDAKADSFTQHTHYHPGRLRRLAYRFLRFR
ncbi:MAG: hemolytic protein HlpA-like protein [Lentisphaerae bacterium RIFOXYB12_FULL_65_16]|nr:MAG: hemolytic protein HlpA-like protein [Lentisphaerae bacterium RIFOXYA12_64_32]OGV87097.1 MAG: hemolytic protein HlpA-like protein [Lentisphaerae bacterium RIFOXYB12_FULL_65_16]